jgi:GMP synthase-like glutamine amidotransferase
MVKIGIIDFNPDQNPDRRQYVKRISALIPKIQFEGLFFKNNINVAGFDALILSGSKLSATDYQRMIKQSNVVGEDYIAVDKVVNVLKEFGKPMFGICFGHQIIAHIHGARLGKLNMVEAGYLEHKLTEAGKNDSIFKNLPPVFYGSHLHSDYVVNSFKGINAQVLATRNRYVHAIKFSQRGVVCYGTQFHPEMSNSKDAVFLVEVNAGWLESTLSKVALTRAVTIPQKADFNVGNLITNFVKNVR